MVSEPQNTSTMAEDDIPPSSPVTKIEPNSPFFLGSQDRPGDFITPTRLRGDNYDDWAGDIQTALEARRKFSFLDGTITAPVSPCTQSDWNTIHAMLVSWIMNTIAPEVKSTLSKYRDAKRLWDTLKSRFAVANGPRIQQLKSSIAKCEQTKSMSVASYFGKLTGLWDELHNHEPLITCSCCTSCSAGSKHEERRQISMLHEFLMGLYSEYYAQLRTSILSQDPLPSLDRAYQLVTQEERVRLATSSSIEAPLDVMSFAVRTNTGRGRGTFDKPDKSHLSCTHCKKTGHEVTSCFEVNGYPEWWSDHVKAAGKGAGRGKASQSGGRGRGFARANMVAASSTPIESAGHSAVGKTSGPPHVFSAEQWQTLAGLIGNIKIPDDRMSGPVEGADWNGC